MFSIFPGGLGKLYTYLARILHWDPVRKQVQIVIAEAPDASMMGKRFTGVIIQTVRDDTGLPKDKKNMNVQS